MKRNFYRRSKIGPITAYRLGLGPLIGRIVLLLTTTGRKTGLERITPLQYELIDGVYHLGAVFGTKTDWVRNILANPQVEVRVKNREFSGHAVVSTDLDEITNFIQFRFDKHPRMVGLIMKMDGLPVPPTREVLMDYAQNLALVRITPDQD